MHEERERRRILAEIVAYRHFKTMGSQYQLSEVDQQNTFVGESAGGVGNVVVTRLEDSSNLR